MTLVLRILLWPLRRLLLVIFPLSDYDGLSAAASTKATQRFASALNIQQHQQWLTNGFAAARQQAVDQSQLLLVVLHSPLSPDSTAFCRNVLPLLDSFVNNPHVAALGVDIQSGQGAQLAQVLQASAFPLLAVLQPTSNSSNLTVLLRAQGESLMNMSTMPAAEPALLQYLHMALARHEALVAEETARRIEREQAAQLRRMQDEEYQETLRIDRERQEQALAQERLRQEEEHRRLEQEQAQVNAIDSARRLVGEEPTSGGCMVRFVLPSGTKLNRRFQTDATISVLKAYLVVYCHDNHVEMGSIGLSTSFPRKTYNEDHEQQLTLEEAGLAGQAVLMVQDLDT